MPSLNDVTKRARKGSLDPVYVLVGTERLLIERTVETVRKAVDSMGAHGFNIDVFDGKGLDAGRVISAARTLPMMADTRLVLLRHVDAMTPTEQTNLAQYLSDPCDSTCLLVTATKLDGRAKLSKAAKKAGVLIEAKPLRGRELREFIRAEATAREHNIAPQAIEALLDAVGDDLAAIDDAVERLSLFVGAGQRIDADAVMMCVTRIRVESIWSLVDAIGLKDRRKGVAAAQSLLDDREPPLRLLAMVARQLRIVARMREALSDGLRPQDAAKRAGAPPFKAGDLTESARRFTAASLGDAFMLIAQTDRALKGSKRPPDVILQDAVLRLCADDRGRL
ncbi:MAG: DNA polymerase III subunit delta [Deltaproteobacteria bacterium]|nr:DNA polymerase III subunit delta [Deltaproteobacteria bacterium]MBW2545947.1 DNA polymerase III subunit delta [Deltaproteobacteria bacterium]RLB44588.1 MAG: DNA polymerase III subunit delta [Deltaproteobacteria bacterium]